jgi:hypothetical protein
LVSNPVIYVFGGLKKLQTDDDSSPVREISEELNESLKTFGIENAHLRTRVSCSDEKPAIPNVPGFDTGMWREVRVGNRLIAVPAMATTEEWEPLIGEIKEMARTIDLLEPFARIRLALDEAKNAA